MTLRKAEGLVLFMQYLAATALQRWPYAASVISKAATVCVFTCMLVIPSSEWANPNAASNVGGECINNTGCD
jgi:hypothetical protein